MAKPVGRPKGSTNGKTPKALRLSKNFMNMVRVYYGFIKANIADGEYEEAQSNIKQSVVCLQNADKMLGTLDKSSAE